MDRYSRKEEICCLWIKRKVIPVRHEREEYKKNLAEKVVREVKDDEEEGKSPSMKLKSTDLGNMKTTKHILQRLD